MKTQINYHDPGNRPPPRRQLAVRRGVQTTLAGSLLGIVIVMGIVDRFTLNHFTTLCVVFGIIYFVCAAAIYIGAMVNPFSGSSGHNMFFPSRPDSQINIDEISRQMTVNVQDATYYLKVFGSSAAFLILMAVMTNTVG